MYNNCERKTYEVNEKLKKEKENNEKKTDEEVEKMEDKIKRFQLIDETFKTDIKRTEIDFKNFNQLEAEIEKENSAKNEEDSEIEDKL